MRDACAEQVGVAGRGANRKARYGRALCVSAAALWSCAALCSVLSSLGWVFDLIAQVSTACAVLGLVVLAGTITLRRWKCAIVLTVSIGLLVLPWALRLIDRPAPTGDRQLTVLVANIYSRNDRIDEVVAFLASSDADVHVLIEPPAPLMRTMRADGELGREQTGYVRQRPDRGEFGWMVVRSSSLDVKLSEAYFDVPAGILAVIVQRGDVRFGLVAVHVQSPRSAARWHTAMSQIADIERAVRFFEAQGLRAVVAGDLNSTPTGAVSRRLERACDVRRSAPIWGSSGTYPVRWPGLLRATIDDVLLPDGMAVQAWSRVEVPGSDHSGVLVRIAIDTNDSPSPRSGDAAGSPANRQDPQP